MNAQRAPVEFCSTWRMMLSRAVSEPPACFNSPGFAFAASMKSFMERYGESARTATTAGSSTSCAIGVRSATVTFASAVVIGPISHALVMRPTTFESPFFSTR